MTVEDINLEAVGIMKKQKKPTIEKINLEVREEYDKEVL